MRALALLKAPYRVIGVDSDDREHARRPRDPARRRARPAPSGKTVEVINTDAEGRLILGDALWYAQQLGATHLVDVATLTGACMVALGRSASGLFGTPDGVGRHGSRRGARAGDRVWPLPIFDEYRDQLRSEIADMVNSGGTPGRRHHRGVRSCRSSSSDRPWAHLDIAGTAWAEEKEGLSAEGRDRRRRADRLSSLG